MAIRRSASLSGVFFFSSFFSIYLFQIIIYFLLVCVCVDFSHPTSSSTSPPKTVDEEVTFFFCCFPPHYRQLTRNIHRETKMNYACGLIVAEMIFNKATSTPCYYHHVLIIPNPSTTSFFLLLLFSFCIYIFQFLIVVLFHFDIISCVDGETRTTFRTVSLTYSTIYL